MSPLFKGFEDAQITRETGVSLRVRQAGAGPALVLLHGYPQTSACWHKVAPQLVEAGFRVILPDLRGYGGSGKPASDADHAQYSKRAMAQDIVALMDHLGHATFHIAGHDRGARVAHRLALDHADRVSSIAVLDIAPTLAMYGSTDRMFATGYYHWFFLIQPAPLPETLIGADPAFFVTSKLKHWGKSGLAVHDPEAIKEYIAAFSDPACIAATCEDYRAAATIDLDHDRADLEQKIHAPLLALWGKKGLVGQLYDVPAIWRERAKDVRGAALPCGHFLPEECPEQTAEHLIAFFKTR